MLEVDRPGRRMRTVWGMCSKCIDCLETNQDIARQITPLLYTIIKPGTKCSNQIPWTSKLTHSTRDRVTKGVVPWSVPLNFSKKMST
jgi:hypothetical protein